MNRDKWVPFVLGFACGVLFMLQCRVGKRTGTAAIKIALDMVKERVISPREALLRVEPEQLNQLLRPTFRGTEKERAARENRFLAKGLNAGPGAASGERGARLGG